LYSRFAELLQERKLTAYRVAQATNISTSTLSDWKRGRSIPKVDKLQKIADFFGVPVTFFIPDGTVDD